MARRIIAKQWNNYEDQVIVAVKLDDNVVYSVEAVWDFINKGNSCYTLVSNNRAEVYARMRRDSTKYLTSHPDKVTENNLDELPNC